MTLILLLHFIVLLIWHSAMASSAENGFTLELIHRDSVESPLYPGNLTELEKIQRLVGFSEPNYVVEQGKLRPIVTADRLGYMVKVGIGSSPPVELHFMIALIIGLSWTQCAPCHPCIPQEGPMYTPSASTTFSPIPGNHPSCKPPNLHARGERCEFVYADEGFTEVTKGIVAHERFTFASSIQRRTESFPGLLFGCAHQNWYPQGRNPLIGGLLGLNPSPESFGAQLAARTGQIFAFSYCLLNAPSRGISYLRFGEDAKINRQLAKVTQLFSGNDLQYHYVKLLDISVAGKRLHLPPGTFRIPGAGNSFEGCTLDISQWATLLARPAYDAVRNALVARFRRYPHFTLTDGADMGGLDLCYLTLSRSFNEFPSIEYHFQGASLHVVGKHSFVFHPTRKKFCVLMKPTQGVTIVGSAQQQQMRFMFDVSNKQLLFHGANCLRA